MLQQCMKLWLRFSALAYCSDLCRNSSVGRPAFGLHGTHMRSGCAGSTDRNAAQQYAAALAPLLGSLTERSCRSAVCAAFSALARLDGCLASAADVLASLDAWSASQVFLIAGYELDFPPPQY